MNNAELAKLFFTAADAAKPWSDWQGPGASYTMASADVAMCDMTSRILHAIGKIYESADKIEKAALSTEPTS